MNILIIDDHPLVREGLRVALQALSSDVCVHEARTADEGLSLARGALPFTLILLDLNLPDANGIDVLTALREEHEEVPVVVLSGQYDAADVRACIEGGSMAFIPKSLPTAALLDALRVVMGGGSYLPEDIVLAAHGATSHGAAAIAELNLTPREIEVTGLLLRAMPNKVIARELGIALSTVKQHLHAIQTKFGASSRYEIMRKAHQFGLTLDH
jgi:DNA-binding NarL/FixJ family response regulator